ncbi:MAG: exodeoxyribonuclease V subunit gamma, partial [Spirochaetales bacterium]|nr:exodeoxyribonuclease V subunit gamma [Spirochaetales bacterium]
MAFNLYSSNRMELLVEYLAMVLDQEKLPPLDSEIIIVQSQGMARFLALELAQRNRVWANGAFPFPNGFLQDLLTEVLDEELSLKKWQRGALAWRIFDVLPSLLTESSFAVLADYCQTPEKSFQLSQQISDLFDQYVLYRPEMIADWSQGNDSSWQAMLWRRLVTDIDQPHRADLFARVLATLSGNVKADLPRRISLFGISSMAPQMLNVFAALGRHVQVNLFFLNPCQEEWSQIMTRASITKAELVTEQDKEEQHLD